MIALSGGNVAEFACSLSTSVRSKETAVQKGAEEIRSMIQKKADSTNFPIGLYCDGKLVHKLTTPKKGQDCNFSDSGTGEAQVELI